MAEVIIVSDNGNYVQRLYDDPTRENYPIPNESDRTDISRLDLTKNGVKFACEKDVLILGMMVADAIREGRRK